MSKRSGYPRKRKSDWPGETGYDYYIVLYDRINKIGISEDTFGDGLKGASEKTFPHAYKSGRAADKDAIILAKKYGYKYDSLAERERENELHKKKRKEMLARMTPAERREYRREEMYD